MAHSRSTAKSLNPLLFQIQKLGLELKCQFCLNLLIKPMLIPCNHIFCDGCIPKSSKSFAECPSCQHQFSIQEIRPAPYIENIVAIYSSLNDTFRSTVLPLLSVGSSGGENAIAAGRTNDPVPGSKKRSLEDNSTYIIAGDASMTPSGVRDHSTDVKNSYDTRETKRQKILNFGSPDIIQSHGHNKKLLPEDSKHVVAHLTEDFKVPEDNANIFPVSKNDSDHIEESICAFCNTSRITEVTGLMMHFANGREVERCETTPSKVISVHRRCMEWAPKVYYSGETLKNLESELARSSLLKCTSCGIKGAALGCYVKSCQRSYHIPCAVENTDCRWDCDQYLMLCPIHKSIRFPSEKSISKQNQVEKQTLSTKRSVEQSVFWALTTHGPQEWVLCGDGLSSEDMDLVVKFALICGGKVFMSWNPNVTHVIVSTDETGACTRSLTFLMAILNGRWVLRMDWVKDCVKANHPVDESYYEVDMDNKGCLDGPKTGRLRAVNDDPKLFEGLRFYFYGDFVDFNKSDLLVLVSTGGGTIVDRLDHTEHKDAPKDTASKSLVVYYIIDQPESATKKACSIFLDRLKKAEKFAKVNAACAIPHSWILESVAAHRLWPYECL